LPHSEYYVTEDSWCNFNTSGLENIKTCSSLIHWTCVRYLDHSIGEISRLHEFIISGDLECIITSSGDFVHWCLKTAIIERWVLKGFICYIIQHHVQPLSLTTLLHDTRTCDTRKRSAAVKYEPQPTPNLHNTK